MRYGPLLDALVACPLAKAFPRKITLNKLILLIIIIVAGYQFVNKPINLSAHEIDPSCDVVVFTTARCPYCKKARAFLNNENINWCERDINQNPEYRVMYTKLGGNGVPFAIFGSTKVHGYSKQTYQDESNKI